MERCPIDATCSTSDSLFEKIWMIWHSLYSIHMGMDHHCSKIHIWGSHKGVCYHCLHVKWNLFCGKPLLQKPALKIASLSVSVSFLHIEPLMTSSLCSPTRQTNFPAEVKELTIFYRKLGDYVNLCLPRCPSLRYHWVKYHESWH